MVIMCITLIININLAKLWRHSSICGCWCSGSILLVVILHVTIMDYYPVSIIHIPASSDISYITKELSYATYMIKEQALSFLQSCIMLYFQFLCRQELQFNMCKTTVSETRSPLSGEMWFLNKTSYQLSEKYQT